MTDPIRTILPDIRIAEALESIAESLKELANPPLWSCGCGHVNPITFAVCAQCGRRPGTRE